MSELDRKLYSLLGDKTLSFGCLIRLKKGDILYTITQYDSHAFFHYVLTGTDIYEGHSIYDVIGHEPTLTDLHRWMNANKIGFAQYNGEILCTSFETGRKGFDRFDYDCTRSLLSQSEETKLAIVNLIEFYE